ncbi:glycosyltransferase family 2 protein [Pseudoalteromonas sp. McH1-7]|uniref:Glycosyltransferase 2-like domain-containing protein n=1 Tax=Pseudoalteromonas peptidolytica F12-50-A1 TaxID=1315280 RepID=A0A8I0MYE0_9GAMM|nr:MULTISPECIES: glycosyltransferase family 2 protein [Pseudoalteromonas]MBE0347440.1 hypothetical protein [Pseudoalteromonas peptidolytica F12-50-A1]MDW7549539.1 glycosyltransferase family 2 protein [Pseudoalteromonas peptidolytica]NLR13203.1 glycosyltransferase family 2 protein [Pseudoalteromonas peptidolytica]NUZ12502.1 glycosyltransferase family 2 protein [Pseudoalteromonas sp. McH1-7]RXF03491.1 glycosyltransferase family 2 protein [Pseudoalteromonas sp. PS5]
MKSSKNKVYPKVSVIIPMFNVEKYIDECICSVLNQTFKNFEVICVDDGCTDNTLNYLTDYKDARIKIVRQPNRGLSGARNTGIRVARGKYIAFLDADDFWDPRKLEKHVYHLDRDYELGVSYCPSLFVDEQSKPLGIGQFPSLKHINAKTILCRNPIGNGSAPVIRKDVLSQIAFNDGKRSWRQYFDENLKQSEDIETWLRIALNTQWKFEGIEEPLTFYRVNASGLSANLTNQFKSWQYAINKNSKKHAWFFEQFGSLAQAYQLRYLSRRALQSRNKFQALKLIHQAIWTNWRILTEEPTRTTLTWCCSLLCILPNKVYSTIERLTMRTIGLLQKRTTA